MKKLLQVQKNYLISMEQSNPYLSARLYIIMGIISISVAQAISKASTVTPFQNLYIRGIILCCLNKYISKESLYVSCKKTSKLLCLSSFLQGINALFMYIGIDMLTLGEAMIIYSTYTIWSQFVAWIILGEKLSIRRIINCFIGILGIVVMSKPTSLFQQSYGEGLTHFYGCMFMLVASCCFSVGITMITLIGNLVPAETKFQHFHFFTLLISSLGFTQQANFDEQIYTFHNILMVFLFSALSYICQILQFKAFGLVSLAKLSPYMNLNILASVSIDILVFRNIPGIRQIIGSSLILLAIILNPPNKKKSPDNKL